MSFFSSRRHLPITTPTQSFNHPIRIVPPRIKNKTLKVRGKKYLLNNNTLSMEHQNTLFYEVQPVYFDEEMFEEIDRDQKVNLLFSWVMGYDKNQRRKECNPDQIHLWCKKIRSPAEITTKHIDIIRQSNKKKSKIKELLYAGEMKIFKEEMDNELPNTYTILLNFSSGSFMANITNEITQHKTQIEGCVRAVMNRIKNNRNINLHIIDDTESFIQETNFTNNNISQYYNNLVNAGIKMKELNNNPNQLRRMFLSRH